MNDKRVSLFFFFLFCLVFRINKIWSLTQYRLKCWPKLLLSICETDETVPLSNKKILFIFFEKRERERQKEKEKEKEKAGKCNKFHLLSFFINVPSREWNLRKREIFYVFMYLSVFKTFDYIKSLIIYNTVMFTTNAYFIFSVWTKIFCMITKSSIAFISHTYIYYRFLSISVLKSSFIIYSNFSFFTFNTKT